jgi:protein-S-isoprenylcysteine O-methyltransferase Ste14
MKRLFISMISNILMIILPLLPNPYLIIHPKILMIILAGIFIWLTQPVFSVKETREQQSKDRFSVILILVMSLISVSVPIIIWEYIKNDKNTFGILSIIGIAITTGGLLMRAWAVHKLGKYFTPTVQIQNEHQLITDGPYKLVRHPSYTGAFLAITGCALILQTLVGYIIAVVAMSIAYKVRIGIEERELTSHFGKRYIDYSKDTKKMIPFIW